MPKIKTDSNFQGDLYSKIEDRSLNIRKVPNSDLVYACYNPFVEALSSTVAQMTFGKPFYHTVYQKDGKVDPEKSSWLTNVFEEIDFLDHAMIAEDDAFKLGIGIDELSFGQNLDTKLIEYLGMERRAPDTFIHPKDDKTLSTSQRWKGIYYVNGNNWCLTKIDALPYI